MIGGWLRWIVAMLIRWLPVGVPIGLVPVGKPGPDSPVLLTGNYILTVRRMMKALRGRDAWLLVAQSHGINVWCAASGGHLTHHEVISVIRTTGIAEKVKHREVVLPQLCATGVERSRIANATGWSVRWGPARLDDLPEFLDRGKRVRHDERVVRFPLRDRLEMALTWYFPMALIALLVVGSLTSWSLGLVMLVCLAVPTFGVFTVLPWVSLDGKKAIPVYVAGVVGALVVGWVLIRLEGLGSPGAWMALDVTGVASVLLLAIDLPGNTPWYASPIHMLEGTFIVDLVEDRCTGVADCVQVCPRDVLVMDGKRRKVRITRPDDCIRCGACIVQCPEDALRFRYEDGRIVEPQVVKTTRLNMLGKRTVSIRE